MMMWFCVCVCVCVCLKIYINEKNIKSSKEDFILLYICRR